MGRASTGVETKADDWAPRRVGEGGWTKMLTWPLVLDGSLDMFNVVVGGGGLSELVASATGQHRSVWRREGE